VVISGHQRSSAVISGKIDLHGERREVSDVCAIQEYGNPPLRAQRHAEEEIHLMSDAISLMRHVIRRGTQGIGMQKKRSTVGLP
jgi:hypothetical protein